MLITNRKGRDSLKLGVTTFCCLGECRQIGYQVNRSINGKTVDFGLRGSNCSCLLKKGGFFDLYGSNHSCLLKNCRFFDLKRLHTGDNQKNRP
jgi:hypothetical protein